SYGNPPTIPPLPRILELISHNVFFYVANTVLPLNLNPVYPLVDFHDWWIIPAFVVFLTGILAAAYWARSERRWLLGVFLGYAACWWAMFAPNGNGVIFNPTDYADRYSYAAAAVLVAFTAYVLDQVITRRPKALGAILLLTLAQAGYAAVRFHHYLPLWGDSKQLFTHAVNSLPDGVYPNDKAIQCIGIISLDDNDAAHLERAALALLKRSLGELGQSSRDSEMLRQLRENHGMMFLICAKVMQHQDAEALKLAQALRWRNGTYYNFNMYDSHVTMPRFLNLLTELLCRNQLKEEARTLLAEFPEPLQQLYTHPSIPNNVARLSFLLGDYQTALVLWRRLEQHGENLEYVHERIREATAALAAQTAGNITAPESELPLQPAPPPDVVRALQARAALAAVLLAITLLALTCAAFIRPRFPRLWRRTQDMLKRHWPYLALAAVVFLCFAPSLTYGPLWHWDDAVYISRNPGLRFTWHNLWFYAVNGFMGLYTPLTMVSFMLDRALFGQHNYIGYHVTAIILQCGSAVFLALILRHLGIRKSIAFLAALLWAVHPQRIESVAWITERKDVLSGCLGLAAVYVFMRSHDRRGPYFLATVLCLLSMAAKPATLLLPTAFFSYVLYRGDLKSTWRGLLAPALTYICFLAVILTINQRLCYSEPPQLAPWPRFIELISHNVLFYISMTFVPLNLNPVYPLVDFHDGWIIPVFIAVAGGIVGLARWSGLEWRWILSSVLGFGLAWWAMFAPNGNGILFNPTDYADRYSYAAAAVLVAFTAWVLDRALNRRPSGARLVIPLAAAYAILVFWQFRQYLPIWKDDTTLFTYAIETVKPGVYPNEKAIESLSVACLDTGNADLLEGAALLMLERTRGQFGKEARDSEKIMQGRQNFGLVILFCAKVMQGRDVEALRLARAIYARHQSYTQIPLFSPEVTFPRYMNLLTEVFCRNNRLDEARSLFAEFADPLNREFEIPDIPNNLARLALLLKDYQSARILWSRLSASPTNNPYVQERLRELHAIIAALPPDQAAQALAPPPAPLPPSRLGLGLGNPQARVMSPEHLRRNHRQAAAFAILAGALLGYLAVITIWTRRRRKDRLRQAHESPPA
ncbi:MAG: hypothetical protein PHC30_03295, partial [Lentisphaeria bacterium]|nr:hypothetical protein [Lentisphaeria bacterium]